MPISGSASNSGGKKIYKALVTQSGTDAPTVVVLENSIGNIVWTRGDAGSYHATLIGAFPENKVFSNCSPIPTPGGSLQIYRADDDNVILQTTNAAGDIADNVLTSPNSILIEVYP